MNGNHSVYNLQYHIVLVVKYRRKCINDEVSIFLISEASRVLEIHGCTLVKGNYDRDHIHLLISTTPTTEPAKLIGVLKKVLSYGVRKNYKNYLADYLWGNSFWSDSYYISTTGGANLETVKRYIQSQRKDD